MEAINNISDLQHVPIVIMAGGKGSRLSPLTDTLPKALIEIDGKPIIDSIIQNFEEENAKDFYLILNHMHEVTTAHFTDKNNHDVNTNFIIEEKPLGTIGGIKLIEDTFSTPFFVTNCDVLVSTHYKNIYKAYFEIS